MPLLHHLSRAPVWPPAVGQSGSRTEGGATREMMDGGFKAIRPLASIGVEENKAAHVTGPLLLFLSRAQPEEARWYFPACRR